MKKGKKLEEVKFDENGKKIKPEKKKIDLKAIGKKVVIGLGLVAGSALAFVCVGLAVDKAYSSDGDDNNTGMDIFDSSEDSEVEPGDVSTESES